MINRELFEKTNKYAGGYFCGGTTDEIIDFFAEKLGVELPRSYRNFLKEFGGGGIGCFHLEGIESDEYSGMVDSTIEFREKISLPKEYVVCSIRKASNPDVYYLTCLDTARMKDGECPVVRYDLITNTVSEYQPTFDDAFNDGILGVYNEDVVPMLAEEPATQELPAGLGYKACWMTVVGSHQDDIVKALGLENAEKAEYKEALEQIRSTPGKVMVTADFDNRNYAMFYGGDFAFHEKTVKEYCADLPEVYGYLSHRVSEAHGFFKVVNGEIVRLFYQDEEEIINIGDPIPEEKKNKIKLPHSFEEARDKMKKCTQIDEDVIMTLAEATSAVEIDTYPYEQVVIGELA